MNVPGLDGQHIEYIEGVEFRIDSRVPYPFANIIADYGGKLCMQVADLDNPGTPDSILATVKELMR